LTRPGLRPLGLVAAAGLMFGVVWSNVLAYRAVSLAPQGQLAELAQIGERYAGQGPAALNEYEPYGARHFLRRLDAEGVSELRRRTILLRTGQPVPKSGYADIDEFRLSELDPFRILVLRRSATGSRPASTFARVYSGRWYEVWRRRAAPSAVLEHLPLGNIIEPSGLAVCGDVMRLARVARPRGRLATVFRPPVVSLSLAQARHPAACTAPGQTYVLPAGAGTATAVVQAPAAGRYTFWIGGSVRSRLKLKVDGGSVGSVAHELNNSGVYSRLGSVDLGMGAHRVDLRYDGPTLAPGSAGPAAPLGPLTLAAGTAPTRVTYLKPGDARSLCGKALDWIEAVRR
jgi:hypothetical protein